MSTYIELADLTDTIVNKFPPTLLQQKLDESDNAVEDLAEMKGVATADIETSPLCWKLKRYAEFWVYAEICLDFLGTNNVDVAQNEKYFVKYEIYKDKLDKAQTEITAEMITGNVGSERDRATVSTGTLFRG